jgi:hypothetical protein
VPRSSLQKRWATDASAREVSFSCSVGCRKSESPLQRWKSDVAELVESPIKMFAWQSLRHRASVVGTRTPHGLLTGRVKAGAKHELMGRRSHRLATRYVVFGGVQSEGVHVSPIIATVTFGME